MSDQWKLKPVSTTGQPDHTVKIVILEHKLQDLQETVDDKDQEIKELKDYAGSLIDANREQRATIWRLREELKATNKLVGCHEKSISHMRKALTAYGETLTSTLARIEGLQARVRAHNLDVRREDGAALRVG